MNKAWKLAAAVALALGAGAGAAFATPNGLDFNLNMKPVAGAMGGAAYTRPQEPSAALFGNPATLAQFPGFNVDFGATYLVPNVRNKQTWPGALAGAIPPQYNESESSARDYIVPGFAMTGEVWPNLVLGLGLEVDGGLGVDYRDDPIDLLAVGGFDPVLAGVGAGGGVEVPLLVELISFNANLGAAYKVAPWLSVGAAGTLGFALAQLGTAGPTSGFGSLGGGPDICDAVAGAGAPGAFCDFGGTTSSVHNFGVGGSGGIVLTPMKNVHLSATYKSPVKYKFENIIHTTFPGEGGNIGWQELELEMPQEVIVGLALDGLIPNLLIEVDGIWKNYGDAVTFEDVWEDQYVASVGAQLKLGFLKLRGGYKWASSLSRNTPNTTLNGLSGLGTIPLGFEESDPGLLGAVGAIDREVIGVVQATLLPSVIEHTVSAGAGIDIGKHLTINLWGAYAFENDITRSTPFTNATLGGLLGVGPLPATNFEGEAELWMAGGGIHVKY
jgi:long-chain fatty acid transport protein